jgi:DNA-binding MltR family transcriptional regulator
LQTGGYVLNGVAHLEEALEDLLRGFFIDQPQVTDPLFAGYGPFESFKARMDTCFALGLISERERRNLEILRRLRNRLAHETGDVSFETPAIKDLWRELVDPPARFQGTDFALDKARDRFVANWMLLLGVLVLRRMRTGHSTIPAPISQAEIEEEMTRAGR